MFKIDWKKWNEAVQAAKGDARKLTMLYSIRAHGRGRVHRRQIALTWYDYLRAKPHLGMRDFENYEFHGGPPKYAGQGKLVFPLDYAYQAAFIGDRWKEFERVVEVKQAV